jgi:hypothetical protein
MAVYGPVRHPKNIIWTGASEVHIMYRLRPPRIVNRTVPKKNRDFGTYGEPFPP